MNLSKADRATLTEAIELLPIGTSYVARNPLSRAVVLANEAGREILTATLGGRSPEDIAGEVAEETSDIPALAAAVGEPLETWEKAGLFSTADLADRFPPEPPPASESLMAEFMLGARRLRLLSDDAAVFAQLATLMADYRAFAPDVAPDAVIRVARVAGGLAVFEDGRPLWRAASPDEARFLAIQAAAAALAGPGIGAVVHGGCLARGGAGLLLAGTTGRGKTTLTLALLEADWHFGGDDMIPLDTEGRAVPLPLGAHLKQTAELEALGELRISHWIDVQGGLLWPRNPAPPGTPVALRAVLFPDFTPGADPTLTPLTPEEALETLITTGTELVGPRPSLAGVTRLLNEAPAARLTYGTSEDALALVAEALG